MRPKDFRNFGAIRSAIPDPGQDAAGSRFRDMNRDFLLTNAPVVAPSDGAPDGITKDRHIFMFRYRTLSLNLLDDFIDAFFQSGTIEDAGDQRKFEAQKKHFIE